MKKIIPLLLGLWLLSGCKTNVLVLNDVLPSTRLKDFQVQFQQTTLTDFSIRFTVMVELKNPFNKDLPFPAHAMGIWINGQNVGLAAEQTEKTVPAKGSLLVTYPFALTAQQLTNMMGKINQVAFRAQVDLNLTDYSSLLPNYKLKVTENWNIETAEANAFALQLTQRKISKYALRFEHES